MEASCTSVRKDTKPPPRRWRTPFDLLLQATRLYHPNLPASIFMSPYKYAMAALPRLCSAQSHGTRPRGRYRQPHQPAAAVSLAA